MKDKYEETAVMKKIPDNMKSKQTETEKHLLALNVLFASASAGENGRQLAKDVFLSEGSIDNKRLIKKLAACTIPLHH